MEFAYKFPAIKGIQARKEYYIAMVPLKMISKLFPDDEEYVEPEYRAQRKLNETRIPVMSNYRNRLEQESLRFQWMRDF